MKRPTLTRHTLTRSTLAGLLVAAGTALGLAAPAGPALADVAAHAAHAAAPTYTGVVTSATGLTQRVAPSTHVARSGTAIRRGAVLVLDCQLNGTVVDRNQRWYKIHGRNAWVSARYVRNVGAAPVGCTAGDWAYEVKVGTNIRQGPSTLDRAIGSLARGTELNTRWITRTGQAVDGNRTWVAVATASGNRGWISVTNLRLVG
ncbi:SH3 domain-containing protein [Nocardioides aromaticivorans]|uniref:SH3 domain-containing protein n=1 Tax=Nocardioides aromaticivorans TaxID=200618 RepID=UPI001A8E91B1|nr:hypothetical protein [Nocardioides aromaticivorans]